MSKGLVKNLLQEHLYYHILESLMDEDYPTTWNVEEFAKLRSFAERKRYCDTHLQPISSGSGRIAYKIDEEKVLKLAKNPKGVAQNEVEIEHSQDRYFSFLLARTFHFDNNGLWVEMELAKKCNAGFFKKMVGGTINEFLRYMINFSVENEGGRPFFHVDEKVSEIFGENKFVQDLKEYTHAYDVQAGDFGKLSSFGIVKRDGQDTLVVIDYGLTKDVHSTHYVRKKRLAYEQKRNENL